MFIDLSLDELYSYKGSSPKPADFDTFWDTALQQIAEYAPKTSLELTPRDECSWGNTQAYDLWFTSFDGARIYAKYMCPKNIGNTTEPLPLLYICHGYSGSSGSWNGLFGHAQQGVHVLAVDCRGQGGYSYDVGNNSPAGIQGTRGTIFGQVVMGVDLPSPADLLYVKIFKDLYLLLLLAVRERNVDTQRIMSLGGSQGGALALVIAALYPAIAQTVSLYPFLSDYKRVYEMGLHNKHAYKGIGDYLRRFYPSLERRELFWQRLGYIDIQYLMPRISANVIMLSGMMDETCPPSTQFAAYNRITANKQVIIFPECGHGGLAHSDDIVQNTLHSLISKTTVGDVRSWLQQVIRPQSEQRN